MMFAEVAFPISNFQKFTYEIPNHLIKKIQVGTRVIAPLRKRNSQGIVVNIVDNFNYKGKIKHIKDLIDDNQVVTKELWDLINWISDYYLTPIGQVAKAVLPTNLSTRYTLPKTLYVQSGNPINKNIQKKIQKRAPTQYKLLKIILSKNVPIKVSSLKKHTSNPHQICKALEKNNLVTLSHKQLLPDINNSVFDKVHKKINFNNEQKNAIKMVSVALQKDIYKPFLLHGVTGSGKTEVFIESVKKCLRSNRDAIVLLPEIALTPQIAGRFRSVFGNKIAIWHSGLTKSQRAWTWGEIAKGNLKVVIGARSAIFAPVKQLGLLVVDEEQESSYSQDAPAPRYNARDVALVRAKKSNSVIILSSATPSLESYYNYINKKFNYIALTERYGGAKYPTTHLVDMIQEENDSGKFGQIISGILQDKIEDRLKKKEQVILLHNRRGYSTSLVCKDCGYVRMCPHCNVAVSFHIISDKHLCHFCGFQEKRKEKICFECNSPNISYYGTGTQKVESLIKKTFPDASISRLDMDSSSVNKVTSILKSFNAGEIDILLGTQMIAKGLDFPNTTLVGIINADVGLYLPDFRAGERIFQLVYQASGRSGRHQKKGEVVIQTYDSNNIVINNASKLNITEYYKIALKERKELGYPPYSWLAKIEIVGIKKTNVMDLASRISQSMGKKYNGLSVLGPTPCYLEKLRNEYRYQIVFKSLKSHDPNAIKLHLFIKNNILKSKDKFYDIHTKINIHFDPLSLI